MVGGRWLGWSVIAALGCTYAAALYLACVVVLRASRRTALLVTIMSSVTLIALACVRVEVELGEATRLLLGNAPVQEPSERARLIAECLSRLLHTLIWIPLLLLPVALVVAFALLWRCPRTWQRDLAATAALLVALTAWSTYSAQRVFFTGFHCYGECQYEPLAQSVEAIYWGKVHLASAVVLCWGWLLVVARKRWSHHAGSHSLMLTGSFLLISGALAALSTSGRRHDTEHPMPLDPSNRMLCLAGPALTRSVPEATPDCVAFDAPYFEVMPDSARIDGTQVPKPEDVRVVLDNKRKLWLELNPEQAFPGAVVIVVRRQATARDLLPWLAAARGAGFTKVGAYVKAPTLDVISKTLGVLHKQRCCLAPFTLDDLAGTPLTAFDDWDGVVQATHASALSIALR
jgi:hypothetical protein